MSDLAIEVTSGPVRVLPVLQTGSDVTLITSDCELVGFSLREASGAGSGEVTGSVTSPGAAAVIASISLLAGVTYSVNWSVELGGTVGAGDANNFQLNASFGQPLTSENAGAVGVYPQIPTTITVGTLGFIRVSSIAAGTVGAVYTANIDITPIAGIAAAVELQDGNNPLAEMSLAANQADSRWYGSGGLHCRSQIKLHVVSGIVAGAVYARYRDYTG